MPSRAGCEVLARFDWEEEAFRYGVDPDTSRADWPRSLRARRSRWPERFTARTAAPPMASPGGVGGLETLRRYGQPWFSLLGRWRRWGRVGADAPAAYRVQRLTAKAGTACQPSCSSSWARVVATPGALTVRWEVSVDSTVVWAHQHAAGVRSEGGRREGAKGR